MAMGCWYEDFMETAIFAAHVFNAKAQMINKKGSNQSLPAKYS